MGTFQFCLAVAMMAYVSAQRSSDFMYEPAGDDDMRILPYLGDELDVLESLSNQLGDNGVLFPIDLGGLDSPFPYPDFRELPVDIDIGFPSFPHPRPPPPPFPSHDHDQFMHGDSVSSKLQHWLFCRYLEKIFIFLSPKAIVDMYSSLNCLKEV